MEDSSAAVLVVGEAGFEAGFLGAAGLALTLAGAASSVSLSVAALTAAVGLAAGFFAAGFLALAAVFLLAGCGVASAWTAFSANCLRIRRATGASTVELADFTNSPCSFRVSKSCLDVTPSSFASS